MPESLSLTERHGWLYWQARLVNIIRTIAAYLGVAVLVVVVMIVSVPSLRSQASMLHEATLSILVPGDVTLDPVAVIDPSVVTPQIQSIDLDQVPARRLAGLRPHPEAEKPIQRTEPMGLLGNTRVDRIEEAMKSFGITSTQLDALENYIARKYRVGKSVVHRLSETVLVAGMDLQVHPVLIFAVMLIESRLNPYAESGAGAQGLMQVMTRVHTDKFEKLGEDEDAAFHPQYNIRVGVQILADCIKRRGSITNGLKCYVGAVSSNDGGYSSKVLAEQRRIALAAKIALPR